MLGVSDRGNFGPRPDLDGSHATRSMDFGQSPNHCSVPAPRSREQELLEAVVIAAIFAAITIAGAVLLLAVVVV
jgi:hypothetical protein